MNENQVSIGLINPKSPTNVGAVMRAAGCYQANNIFYTGKRYANAAKFNTDTNNIKGQIPLIPVEHIQEMLSNEVKLVCVDLVEGAIPLPEFEHPDNALYIFGPEDGTIPQHVIDEASSVVYVPTVGCMNLAASVNVLLYDRLVKRKEYDNSNELIRQSRDTNNRTKIKV
jgi:tRNA(Leu) C34 or U34 (ribose-2'-O)-methylase TrmL